MRRRPFSVLAAGLILVALLGGCGGGDSSESGLAHSLSYLPKNVTTVVTVSTDLDSEPFREAGRSVAPALTGQPGQVDVEDLLRRAADASSDLSYDSEVAPLLGKPLVIGTSDPEGLASQGFGVDSDLVVVFETNTDTVRDLLDRFGENVKKVTDEDGAEIYSDESGSFWLALDGDTAVATLDRGDLFDALAQADRGDGFTEAAFDRALGGLPRDAPLRAYADISRLREIPQVRPLADLPWFDALRSAGASVTVEDGALAVEGVANTDPSGLSADDLPLAAGETPPEIVREKGKVSGASANQSQTTAFLLAALRAGFPDSDFVRDVDKVEKSLGIDFEKQVLRQFDGPSASVLKLPSVDPVATFPPGDGQGQKEEFAARSEVSDPRGLAKVMRRLAPDLGRLIQDLQGLQSQGLAALFLVAPDAPIRPGVLPVGQIEVETVPGEPDFYRIAGLSGGVPFGVPTPVPDEVVFGLVGNQFTVASSVEAARKIAGADSTPVSDVRGASVIEAQLPDLGTTSDQLSGVSARISGSLQASLAALRGELRVEFR